MRSNFLKFTEPASEAILCIYLSLRAYWTSAGAEVPSLGPSLQEVSVSKAEAGAGVMNKHCNIIIVAPGYWFSKALLPEALPDLRRWVKKKY